MTLPDGFKKLGGSDKQSNVEWKMYLTDMHCFSSVLNTNEQVSDLVAEVKQERHDEIKQERGYTKAENTSNELPTH